MSLKHYLLWLLVLICLKVVSTHERNFIKNGDFSKLVVSQISPWTISKSLTSWEVVREVEFGHGRFYNQRWGDRAVIEIDSNQNDILRQRLNLKAGRFFIEIEYAGREGYVSTSQFSLSWNGVKLRTIKAQDEEIHREKIYVNAFSGQNTLEIIAEGESDRHGMTFSQVQLYSAGVYDFISNGDFSKISVSITPPRQWILLTSLPPWWVRQVQVGYGKQYNSRWGERLVIELDSYQNDILTQQISLEAGQYFIEIEYAAREGVPSQMSVTWNGKKRFIKGQDEEIHIEIIPVVAVAGINTLEIAGEGKNDTVGMIISRVSLL